MFFSPPEKKLMEREKEREKKGQTSQQHAEKIKSWKIYNPASDICALIVDTALSEKKSSDHVLAFFPNLVWILDYMYSKKRGGAAVPFNCQTHAEFPISGRERCGAT
jgi:hypothetical protein